VVLQMSSGNEAQTADGSGQANAAGTANDGAAADAKAKTEKKSPAAAVRKTRPVHDKKRMAPKRAALNSNRRKPVAKARPAEGMRQGG